jgi:hypothetical protein
MNVTVAPAPDTTTAPEPTGLECWREDLTPRWRFPIRLDFDFLDSSEQPWVSKKELAAHLRMSERWIDYRKDEGMPHDYRGNRPRFQIGECEVWLAENGRVPAGAAS